MHRTQVYLDEQHYQLLRSRARRDGTTLAALIREAIEVYLRGERTEEPDTLGGIVGIGKGDGSAVAENYEDYLYGARK